MIRRRPNKNVFIGLLGSEAQLPHDRPAPVGPGGAILAAAITRFASTLDGIAREFLADAEFEPIVEGDVDTGVHLNPTRRPGWFTTAYSHRPDELRAELESAGFTVEAVLAIEG